MALALETFVNGPAASMKVLLCQTELTYRTAARTLLQGQLKTCLGLADHTLRRVESGFILKNPGFVGVLRTCVPNTIKSTEVGESDRRSCLICCANDLLHGLMCL